MPLVDLATEIVTGAIAEIDGSARAGDKVTFTLFPGSTIPGVVIPSGRKSATVGVDGLLYSGLVDINDDPIEGIELWANEEGDTSSQYRVQLPSGEVKYFILTEGGETDLAALITLYAGPSDANYTSIKAYIDATFLTPAAADALFLTPAEGNAAFAPLVHNQSADTLTSGKLSIARFPYAAQNATGGASGWDEAAFVPWSKWEIQNQIIDIRGFGGVYNTPGQPMNLTGIVIRTVEGAPGAETTVHLPHVQLGSGEGCKLRHGAFQLEIDRTRFPDQYGALILMGTASFGANGLGKRGLSSILFGGLTDAGNQLHSGRIVSYGISGAPGGEIASTVFLTKNTASPDTYTNNTTAPDGTVSVATQFNTFVQMAEFGNAAEEVVFRGFGGVVIRPMRATGAARGQLKIYSGPAWSGTGIPCRIAMYTNDSTAGGLTMVECARVDLVTSDQQPGSMDASITIKTVVNGTITSGATFAGANMSLPGTLTVTGSITATAGVVGNASTATSAATLTTARNINGVAFNGSADITVPAAAGTLTGTTLAANVVTSSITSVGTLAALTVTAQSTFTTGLTIGATSGSDSAGSIIFRTGEGLTIVGRAGSTYQLSLMTSGGSAIMQSPIGTANVIFAGNVSTNGVFQKSGTQVVGARKTGWATATGTPTRSAFDTATVTLPQLAERVKALLDDLHSTAGHGLIGT